MRRHDVIDPMLDAAQKDTRCAYGTTPAERRAFRRRLAEGTLVSPYRNVYARADYWSTLTPIERVRHTVGALGGAHPNWVFAGPSAACVHGLDHPYAIHASGTVHIASTHAAHARDHDRLERIRMKSVPAVTISGIRVTPVAHTILDCGMLLPFRQALPLFDSAAKAGVPMSDVESLCADRRLDPARIMPLCAYADPLSDNGGESQARAVIIAEGFIVPELQHRFENPANPASFYRADFTWTFPDGRIVVAEYDGMGKYVMESNMKRESIQQKVHDERVREEHLRMQGVQAIVRFEFEDVTHPGRLERKLTEAGIPSAVREPGGSRCSRSGATTGWYTAVPSENSSYLVKRPGCFAAFRSIGVRHHARVHNNRYPTVAHTYITIDAVRTFSVTYYARM